MVALGDFVIPPRGILDNVSTAEERRRRRAERWTTTLVAGDFFEHMQAQDLCEHREMGAAARVALCWTLSEQQFGMFGGASDERGLPRSDLRVHRR